MMWDIAAFIAASVVLLATIAATTILWEMLRHVRQIDEGGES